MRRSVLLVLAVAAGGCGRTTDPGPPPVAWSGETQAAADANTRFGLALYAKLREKAGNLVFSPYSAHAALAMTATGARGPTQDEMRAVLHLPDAARLLAAGDLGRYYAHPRKDFALSVANALWGQKDFGWKPEFTGPLGERFGAAFHEADFRANPDAERGRINAWVKERTRDKVPELFAAGQIHGDTRLALVNAVYFKGVWQEEFPKGQTRDAPFRLADGTTVNVPTMSRREGAARSAVVDVPPERAGRDDGTRLLELPYRGGELAMVFVVPPTPDGLPALEARLTPELLAAWLGALRDDDRSPVAVPRFRFKARFADLPAHLRAMGMILAFQDVGADFSCMTDGGGLYVDQVVQEAFIDVNEEGTEAAAATGVTMAEVSARLPIQVDRPFLFLIRDVRKGTILFLGRATDPRV